MLAVTFWIFTLDFTTIVSFLFGIIIGIIILSLVYALMVLLSLRDKKYTVVVEEDTLSEKEAKEMIQLAITSLNDKKLRNGMSKTKYFGKLCYDLVYGIASSFFPKSKYPLFEITVDEAVDLIGYVQVRLNEILDKKAIRLVKKMNISNIVSMAIGSMTVVDSKTFQITKEMTRTATTVKKIVDIINPLNWVKRIFVNTTITIVMNKLFEVTLMIVGEEAYKVYSKALTHQDVDITSDVDKMVESLEEEIKSEIIKVDDAKKNLDKAEEIMLSGNQMDVRFKSRSYVLPEPKEEYNSIYDKNNKFKKRHTNDVSLEKIVKENGNEEK